MKRKILCPTDFSPASDAALVFAASLARGTNSQLLIVHVGDTNLGHPGEGVYLPPTAAAKAEVGRLLRQVVPDECDDYEHRLAVGDPATEIQRLAEAENVEAIVMGTHGRGALSRMLMGSVAEHVARHATCPVLTVTVPEKQRASTKLVGEGRTMQSLVAITRTSSDNYEREELGDVRFVPLVGARGWQAEETGQAEPKPSHLRRPSRPALVAKLVRESAEPIAKIEGADLGSLLERIGSSRLVLVGEGTHGTSEFYRMRAEITKQLITRRGFRFVAIEADWPDAARVDAYVRDLPSVNGHRWEAFSRFPTWMWRNREVLAFIEWLREYNRAIANPNERVGFYGLDLYSMFTSIRAVLDFLDLVDPEAARIARLRYGCLTPWESDPATYGRMAVGGRFRVCEDEAVATLTDLLKQRLAYAPSDGARFFDAVQNARLVVNAERYYRAMYRGSNESWNLRDQHMFDTLELLLDFHASASKAVIWEHNSHLGDAAATEMGASGQTNVGHLCRERFADSAYLIGQGTDHGTVAAAANWDEPVEFMHVNPGHPGSYENLCHDSQVEAFFLPLRDPFKPDVRIELATSRLERAIGVIYRPATELASHYFHARLTEQFDEWIWFDGTKAVSPISSDEPLRLPAGHPFEPMR